MSRSWTVLAALLVLTMNVENVAGQNNPNDRPSFQATRYLCQIRVFQESADFGKVLTLVYQTNQTVAENQSFAFYVQALLRNTRGYNSTIRCSMHKDIKGALNLTLAGQNNPYQIYGYDPAGVNATSTLEPKQFSVTVPVRPGQSVPVTLLQTPEKEKVFLEVRVQPVPGILGKNPKLVSGLVETLKTEDEATRANVRDILYYLGKDAVPGLIAGLAGSDFAVQAQAAALLEKLANDRYYVAEEAIPTLVKAVQSGEVEVSRSASAALKAIIQQSAGQMNNSWQAPIPVNPLPPSPYGVQNTTGLPAPGPQPAGWRSPYTPTTPPLIRQPLQPSAGR